MPLSRCARWVVFLLTAAALGCTDMVRVQASPSVLQHGIEIHRLAVAPFQMRRLATPPIPGETGSLVAGFFGDAMARRGVEVIPATDVAQGLGLVVSEEPAEPIDARSMVRSAAEKFGADVVAVGMVSRWRERSGQAAGTLQPASTGFEVRLYSASAGALLWAGAFDETQVALGANVLAASQYPGGGTRWLTASEFARFGADQIASRVPLAAR